MSFESASLTAGACVTSPTPSATSPSKSGSWLAAHSQVHGGPGRIAQSAAPGRWKLSRSRLQHCHHRRQPRQPRLLRKPPLVAWTPQQVAYHPLVASSEMPQDISA